MQFIAFFFSLFFIFHFQLTTAIKNPEEKFVLESPVARIPQRSRTSLRVQGPWGPWQKRGSPFKISECVFVTSEETKYYYKADSNSDQVCGIYFFTDPDRIIEIYFDYLNVPCENGGLVSFLDGWELNGQFFPSIDDHEKKFEDRYYEFCGAKKLKKVLVTSQNAGMLHYRIPNRGSGFSFYVRFAKSRTPCNVLVESTEGVYTLRNYGKMKNCTLMAVFPAKVKVLALNVGVLGPRTLSSQLETGTFHKCSDGGGKDAVEIGGGEGLDSSKVTPFEEICGMDSTPQSEDATMACGVTSVKLVSSGAFDNSVTFSIAQADENDFLRTTFICESN